MVCHSRIHVLGTISHKDWRSNRGTYHHSGHEARVLSLRSRTILTKINIVVAIESFMAKFFTNLVFRFFFCSLNILTLLPFSLNLWSLRFSNNFILRLGTKLVVLWSEEIFVIVWKEILVLWIIVRLRLRLWSEVLRVLLVWFEGFLFSKHNKINLSYHIHNQLFNKHFAFVIWIKA